MPSGPSVACSAMARKHMEPPGFRRPTRRPALIVDFGGVLTTSIWPAFAAFCESVGLAPGTVRDLFRGDGRALALLRGLETGELADPEFERRFGELLGLDEHDGLITRMFAGVATDERMVGAVRAARAAGVPTGLISNSWGLGIYDRAPTELFDATVISGEVGLHKPQPEIYLLGCERLGVEPAEAVFVDDLRENCEGAEAVGMTAVRHRDAAETLPALERLLGVALATTDRSP
ncbi:MAG: HAD-IA family hydrolase [Solirubrobacterales bacterium]|nr:HAD-IA family hydrolase [Solirubrobacterales bacterium]